MARISEKQLNYLATCNKLHISGVRMGEQLTSSGYTVAALLARITADRIRLGAKLSREAEGLLTSHQYRSAISRAYYAEYHVVRAVVYYMTPGDDYEAHTEVPKHLPGDFPARTVWQQQLKTARLDRNRADYDPYPASNVAFEAIAQKMCAESAQFVTAARKYLRSKGCKI